MLRILTVLCALVLLIPAWTQALAADAPAAETPADSTGPSFSCAVAGTAAERAICADPALAAADREMAALFALARVSAFGTSPSNQLAAQRRALRQMRSCDGSSQSYPMGKCLAAAYAARNGELATAVVMSEPARALAVLRRLDTGYAPVIEATALWAAQPVDADWSAPERTESRKRIAALLAPYMTALRTDEKQSFGWSILSDPGGDGPAVKAIDDVFASDRHFAAFLNVLGPYLPEQDGPASAMARAVPCAAIVRHPALLGATDALFGSTMDNFVLHNDCEAMLPPTPALAALDAKITKSWPDCDGTIRFAAYRGYGTALDAARLGLARRSKGAALTPPKGVTAAQVEAARSELTRYYAQYLGKTAKVAAVMARDALADVLDAAHSCGT